MELINIDVMMIFALLLCTDCIMCFLCSVFRNGTLGCISSDTIGMAG